MDHGDLQASLYISVEKYNTDGNDIQASAAIFHFFFLYKFSCL